MTRKSAMRGMSTGLFLLAMATAPAQAADEVGRQLFNKGSSPACAVCHTLKDAGADGQGGPILDDLKPGADRVATALRNGIGYMPAYKDSLTEEQIQALARYVSTATGAK